MNKNWIGMAGATAVLLTGTPAAVAAPPTSGINGAWVSVDFDGSNQTLAITGSGSRRSVQLYDDAATQACDGAPAYAQGAGPLDGDTLVAYVTVVCQPGGSIVRGRIELGFTYDGGTDTITDFSGIVWTRA